MSLDDVTEEEEIKIDHWEHHCSTGYASCDFGWCLTGRLRPFQGYYVRVTDENHSENFCSDCAAVAMFHQLEGSIDCYSEEALQLKKRRVEADE